MAYSAHVGSFNINTALTATQTQAITGVGFQPKVVLFWWSGTTDTGDGVRGGNIQNGFGAMSGASSRIAAMGGAVDASAACDSCAALYNTACIVEMSITDFQLVGAADFSSLDADGFTLVIDDQFPSALRISYLALGGTDLTDVYIGTKAMPTSTGNYSTTGVGFQPDALITAFATTTANGAAGSAAFSVGMATGSGNQGVAAGYMHNDFATMLAKGYGYGGEVNASVAFSTVNHRDAFVSFDADGFTLNHLESTTAWTFGFVALKGGQYKVCSVTTATDANTFSDTEAGFQPAALLLLSANRAQSTQDTLSANWAMSIGAATSTSNRAAQAVWNEDGLADSETASGNYDSACYANVKDDGVIGLMDISSIDATGVTFVMDDADPSACWVTYLAIGAAAASGEDVTPAGIPSTTAVANPTLTATATATPASIASTTAVANLSLEVLTGTIEVAGIASTSAIANPDLSIGATNITLTGIASTTAIANPDLTAETAYVLTAIQVDNYVHLSWV